MALQGLHNRQIASIFTRPIPTTSICAYGRAIRHATNLRKEFLGLTALAAVGNASEGVPESGSSSPFYAVPIWYQSRAWTSYTTRKIYKRDWKRWEEEEVPIYFCYRYISCFYTRQAFLRTPPSEVTAEALHHYYSTHALYLRPQFRYGCRTGC